MGGRDICEKVGRIPWPNLKKDMVRNLGSKRVLEHIKKGIKTERKLKCSKRRYNKLPSPRLTMSGK